MASVIGADEHLGLREAVADLFDDLQRRLGIIDADHDDIGLLGSRMTQDVQPCAVAEEDLESIATCITNAVGIAVDHRQADAPSQQRLRGDLSEASEADQEDAPAEITRFIDTLPWTVRSAAAGLPAIINSGVMAIERMMTVENSAFSRASITPPEAAAE